MKNLLTEEPVWLKPTDQIKKLNFKSLWIDYGFGEKYNVTIKILENKSQEFSGMIEFTPSIVCDSKEIDIISNVKKYLNETAMNLIQNIRVNGQDVLLLNLDKVNFMQNTHIILP